MIHPIRPGIPKVRRHSIRRWLEIEGYPEPTRLIRQMKENGIYISRVMKVEEFYDRINQMIVIWLDEGDTT